MVVFQAVNKLAEIMNRKEFSQRTTNSKKVNASELRKKEKECRKLQQDLTQVRACEWCACVWESGVGSVPVFSKTSPSVCVFEEIVS